MPESSELTHETIAELFADIADAIRSKTGVSKPIIADTFPNAILDIPGGNGTSDGSVYQDSNGYIVLSNEGGFSVMQEITVATDGAVTQELQPNTLYHFTGTLTSLTITLASTEGIAYYHFDFNSGSTAVTLTLPNSITMPDDFSVETNYRYEIDILNAYGTVQKWGIA